MALARGFIAGQRSRLSWTGLIPTLVPSQQPERWAVYGVFTASSSQLNFTESSREPV